MRAVLFLLRRSLSLVLLALPLGGVGSGTLFLVLRGFQGLTFSFPTCLGLKERELVAVAVLVPRCRGLVWLFQAKAGSTTSSGACQMTGSRLVLHLLVSCACLMTGSRLVLHLLVSLLLVALGRLDLTRFASRWVPDFPFLLSALAGAQ